MVHGVIMTRDEIIHELEQLVKEAGYLYSLAIMAHRDLSVDVNEILGINWYERISFREFSFLVGLLTKQVLTRDMPSTEVINRHIESTYKLLQQLHECHMDPLKDLLPEALENSECKPEKEKVRDFKKLFGSGQWMTEPMFYGAAGAYGFQFLELASRRYVLDDEWLVEKKKCNAVNMAALTQEVKELLEKKARELSRPSNHEDACRAALSVLCFKSDELVSVGAEARNAFLQNFSMTPGVDNQHFFYPGSYNRAESHPLIALGNDEYFLPVWFNLAQSVYESPFYWMVSDSEYKETSFRHRGEATEAICCEMLLTVCGSNRVFKNVKVSRNKGQLISDVDVLAILGNKAIIIQAKSKKLTELARQGDESKLRSDFREGIQKAYDQGIACRNAILDHSAVFTSATGETIHIDEAINDAYIVCVTSDEYPAVIHHVDAYLSKEAIDPFPIVISIFDLEIITFYLNDPFDLFYYVRQRIGLSTYFRGEEISLLGFHLNQKLYPRADANFILVDQQFAQLIDANYPVARGYQRKTEAFDKLNHEWKNVEFELLLSQVKQSKHPGVTDAIFLLLDLSGDSADKLMAAIAKVKAKARFSCKAQTFTMVLNQMKDGISFLVDPDIQADIEQSSLFYAMAKKYETRAERWLGFGSLAGSMKVIDAVVYSDKPWKEDPQIEEMAEVLLKGSRRIFNSQMKPIGRNEPCFCGSGKKYKKCHLK